MLAAAALFAVQLKADSLDGRWLELLVFVLLFMVAEARAVLMPRVTMTVTFVLVVVAFIHLPPVAVTAASALSILGTFREEGGPPQLAKALFNATQLALSGGLAAEAFRLLYSAPDIASGNLAQLSLAAIAATGVYFFVNTLSVSGALSLAGGTPFSQTWFANFGWVSVTYLSFGAVGVLLASLYELVGFYSLPLLFAPLIVARSVFRAYKEVEDAYKDTIQAFVKAIEAKDIYTEGHSQRVTEYSSWIAERLGIHGEELDVFRYGALLHDVGKLAVRRATLTKPGRLEDYEFEEIKEHPVLGARIVKEIEFLKPALDGVLYHHERLDGSGYPAGLAGDLVPLNARIMAVADTFDAMTSTRAYRGAKSMDEALAELRRCSGTQFDPKMVEIFLQVIQEEDRYRQVTERIAEDAQVARTPA